MPRLKHIPFFLSITLLFSTISVPLGHAINIPFTLTWYKNTEPDIKGYYIYIGNSIEETEENESGIFIDHYDLDHYDPDKDTLDFTINQYVTLEGVGRYQLNEGETYWIALSAFDIYNNESIKTDPISVDIDEIVSTTSTIFPQRPSPPQPTSPERPSFPSTTSIKPDETPPTGTIRINQGDESTSSHFVTLSFSVTDGESGMGLGAQMSFSNDDSTWSSPEAYLPQKDWRLTPVEGKKTVYAKFSDAAGNWMDQPITDSIELQLSCPKPLQLDVRAVECSGAPLAPSSEDKTVDGKITTGWLSPLQPSVQDEYITLDLGETRVINRIDICSNSFLFLNLFPRDFKVLGGTDNQQWLELFAETDYSPPFSRTDSWLFDNTGIRYIKMHITRTRPFLFFFHTAYIAEIKVFGCAKSEIAPRELRSTGTSDQTRPGVKQQTLDTQRKEKKQLLQETVTPGRPGKPFFILKNNP